MLRPRRCGRGRRWCGASSRSLKAISASSEMSASRRPGAGVRHGLLLGVARPCRGPYGGVDFSGEQLATARRVQGRLGPAFPLVQGDAEPTPLASGGSIWVSEPGSPPGAARGAGSRRGGCCSSRASGCSGPTATCRRCACLTRPGLRETVCCAASLTSTGCNGPAAGSSSTPRTGTGSGCCGDPASWSKPCTRSSRPKGPTIRPTRSCRASGRAGGQARSSGWPAAHSGRLEAPKRCLSVASRIWSSKRPTMPMSVRGVGPGSTSWPHRPERLVRC